MHDCIQLIQSGTIQLANNLLNHDDVSVIKCNDAGMDCISMAEQVFTNIRQLRLSSSDDDVVADWNEFIQELKRREMIEKERMEERDRARSQANDE